MASQASLLTRNETDIDKEWMNQAHRHRFPIKLYEFNKISNATAIRSLKGPTNLESINHRFDYGDKAKSAVLRASRHLNTEFPGSEGKLKRDYLMLKDAESIYFIGNFSTGRERLQVSGNEAWLVEMFYDIYISKHNKPKRFPIYMYNTHYDSWCQLTMTEDKENPSKKLPKWIKISRPPRPRGNFVGVGGSILNDNIRYEIGLFFK